MRNLLRKIERECLNKRVFTLLFLFFTAAMAAPLLYLGRYIHMSGDDYWYGIRPRFAWADGGGIPAILAEAAKNVRSFYVDWQGTYSSVFMFSLTPSIFGEQYYAVVPLMMLGMIFISTLALFYVLCVKISGSGLYNFWIFALMACFLQIEFIHSPAQALYWYNGAVHYVFMQGFAIFSLALMLAYFQIVIRGEVKNAPSPGSKKERTAKTILLILMAICGPIAAGANHSTALLTIEFFSIFLLLAVYLAHKHKTKQPLFFLIPYALTLGGFLAATLAPGNSVRQAYFNQMGFGVALLNAFSFSFRQLLNWLDIFVVLSLLLLIPFIIKYARQTTFRFPLAPLVALLSYGLYASMFMPAFYAMGNEPISRNQNICKMFLFITLVFNEFYLLGWLIKKTDAKYWERLCPQRKGNLWAWCAYMAAIVIVFALSFASLDFVAKKATFVSFGAFDALQSGEAAAYHAEYLARLHHIKSSEEKIIYVPPYSVKPYPIWIRMDSEESSHEGGLLNIDMVMWYGKHGIYETVAE